MYGVMEVGSTINFCYINFLQVLVDFVESVEQWNQKKRYNL